jgi:hypothetical protein
MEKQNEMKGRLPVLEFYNNLAKNCAGIFEQSMGARNRVGTWLSYRPAKLHSSQPGGTGYLESILGLLKSLKIPALSRNWVVVLARQALHRLAESILGFLKV